MAGSTANLGLQYALPGDALSAWPATSQNLASKVDTELYSPYLYNTDSGTVSIPNGVWTKVNTVTLHNKKGTGVEASGGGISNALGGLYEITAFIEWSANSVGARIMGVGLQSGSGADTWMRDTRYPLGSLNQAATWLVRLQANSVWHLWVNQSSGAALNLSYRRWGIRLIDMD